jgi:hypothetical protein
MKKPTLQEAHNTDNVSGHRPDIQLLHYAQLTRVNSTNVQYEGFRIGGVGRRMNSKVKSVKQGVYRK